MNLLTAVLQTCIYFLTLNLICCLRALLFTGQSADWACVLCCLTWMDYSLLTAGWCHKKELARCYCLFLMWMSPESGSSAMNWSCVEESHCFWGSAPHSTNVDWRQCMMRWVFQTKSCLYYIKKPGWDPDKHLLSAGTKLRLITNAPIPNMHAEQSSMSIFLISACCSSIKVLVMLYKIWSGFSTGGVNAPDCGEVAHW